MSISPFFRTPLTDLFGVMINGQYGKCQKFEMDFTECLEVYGLDKGRSKCRALGEDFQECINGTKQFLRVAAMENERKRQYEAGLRKERYEPPPVIDSY